MLRKQENTQKENAGGDATLKWVFSPDTVMYVLMVLYVLGPA